MCGRFALSITAAEFACSFGTPPPAGFRPRYNIAPGTGIAAIRGGPEGYREALWMEWGLVAPWKRDPKAGPRPINARIESAAEKPMFREAFRLRRCIVPADGFFEWRKRQGRPARPYFVRRRDGAPLLFAALWSPRSAGDGEPAEKLPSCAILTRPAVPAIAGIHPRMPLLLAPEQLECWLDPGVRDPAVLRELVADHGGIELEAVPVGLRVNDPRQDDPGILDRAPEVETLEPRTAAQGRLF